jgi:site-specific DNA recombinase
MNAVLYTRVSTDEQADDLNLSKQEDLCRSFCSSKGYNVLRVFTDVESARTTDRPAFQEMRLFCRRHRHELDCVVVQDLSRLARNAVDQGQCIADLRALGVKLCSTYEQNVDDTAAGRFAAGILGTVNEFFSNALSEKMKDRMRASASAGRYPWRAPIGYLNTGCSVGSNIAPDPDRAPLISQAFELISTGHKQSEALKIVTDAGLRTMKGKPVTAETFSRVLRNPIYYGRICPPSMNLHDCEGVVGVQGLHQPIISEQIFNLVQQILAGKKPVVVHQHFNADLPLKVLVLCAACGTPLTGGMCKGRTKRYGHYWCRLQGCRTVKTTKKNLEAVFVDLLKRLSPRAEVISSFPKIAERVFAEQQVDAETNIKRLSARLEKLKELKAMLLTAKLNNEVLQDDYEQGMRTYTNEIAVIQQELQAAHATGMNVTGFLRFVELSLINIAVAWEQAEPAQRQTVQTLLFEGGLTYDQQSNSLNHPNPCLFNVLEQVTTENFLLASPAGFEPAFAP